jgi:hypothetical protein
MRAKLLSLLLALVSTACVGDNSQAMKRFVDGTEIVVREHRSIKRYLTSSAVAIQDIREVSPKVMEYSFVETYRWMVEPDKRCRFVFIVDKETELILGWRYNDKPQYCLQSL